MKYQWTLLALGLIGLQACSPDDPNSSQEALSDAPEVHPPTDSVGWVDTTAGGALIQGNHKVINEPLPGGTEATPWRLYDLGADPGETRDLAAEFPERVAELVGEWETNWR